MLILAGDIHPSYQVRASILKSLEDYYQIPVVMVKGNHDYWYEEYNDPGTDFIDVQGFTIASNTFWTDLSRDPWASPKLLNFSDKKFIKGFNGDDWQRVHERAMSHFRSIKPDIVVTHHAPSYRSVSPEFVGNPYNTFFVSDHDLFISELNPLVWIHGHVHSAWDYMVDQTRVLCNPLGYPGEIKRPVDIRIVEVKR